VATQVVSDFVTDDPQRMMAAGGKPVVQYLYKMAFMRVPPEKVDAL
jgi:hypothetical protein